MPRRTFWNEQILGFTTANGAETLISLLSGLGDATEMTLIRTIVRLDVMVDDSAETNSSIQRMSMGIGITSEEAFSIGTTAISDPATASEHPSRGWVYRTSGAVFISNVAQGGHAPWRINDDIRTKRKIDRGDLFMKFQNDNLEGATNTLITAGVVRCLLMLP